MNSAAGIYINKVITAARSIEPENLKKALSEIRHAFQNRKCIYLIGNGPSANTAAHFATDLLKNCGEVLKEPLGFGPKVVSLTDSMPSFTAMSNDILLSQAYAECLRLCASPGDLLIVFACGTPHENLEEAARFGMSRGMRIVTFAGGSPKRLAEYSHVLLSVDSAVPQVVDCIHTLLCHSFAVKLKTELRQPVVFLDRDGVINQDRVDYIRSWNEFRFLPKVAQSIRRLNANGYAVVIITNQSVVGRNLISQETLDEIHEKMLKALYAQGAVISRIYCCVHSPKENCLCRKPKPGLIRKAFDELPIDPEKAVMVGDRLSDILAGKNGGITTIHITGQPNGDRSIEIAPDFSADDLSCAVELILSEEFQRHQQSGARNMENQAGGENY